MVDYIKQGDCLELMREIPDKSIDLIICDLPYGVTKNKWDKQIDWQELWVQYKRIIKDNAAIVLFGQGKFFVDLVNSNRKWFRYDLIWDKVIISGFLNAYRMPLRRHEQIKRPHFRQTSLWNDTPSGSLGPVTFFIYL